MEYFSAWDYRLLFEINRGLTHPLNDWLMILWSKEWPWIILALSILLFAWNKRSWVLSLQVIWAGLTVGVTDAVAYYLIKPWIGRIRPCRTEEWIRAIDGCAGSLGFPSNHAANAAAFACIWFFLRGPREGAIALACCLVVSFSRVYLGVHYPSDVIFGMLLGALIGFLSFQFLRRMPLLQILAAKASKLSC